MNLIAAVDNKWGIGKEGKLLTSIPNDMKFFRSTTSGKIVVMGRVTLESFPNGAPLKNRVNIVLTRNENYAVEGAVIVHSKEEAMAEIAKYDTDDVFIIGGDTIYSMFVDDCKKAYITKIDYAFDADAFFPNLDEKKEWEIVSESEEMTYFDLPYQFVTYEKEA